MTTNRTRHLLLNYLTRSGHLSDDDFKVLGLDRDTIDTAIWAALNHHHVGGSTSSLELDLALELTLDDTAGVLAAGHDYYYKYTLVDEFGVETAASPEAHIRTPNPVLPPSAPTFVLDRSGGTLLPGEYNYVLTAYKGATTLETLAVNVVHALLSAGSTTYAVVFTLPPLPAGADGFNIYRQAPGESGMYFLDTIDMMVATPPETYTDDGSVSADGNRQLPRKDRTNAQNSVIIDLPGATPELPAGYTWRLYRSLLPGVYSHSLVHWVVEETSEGSGVITTTYRDLGYETTDGQPPSAALILPHPERVLLTDGEEVQGVLPPANIVFRHVEEFVFPGPLDSTKVGSFAWRCPFTDALIIAVVASLGLGSLASGADVIVDVNRAAAGSGSFDTIFTDQSQRPRIVVGEFESAEAVPAVAHLQKGDRITVDLDEIGGAATPTDGDLLVQILMYFWDDTATSIVRPV